MSHFVLVRGARQLISLRGNRRPRRGNEMRDLGLIENGALLIEGKLIREIGPARRIENLVSARSAREIDASGCVVMPGFVDSHTHLVCGPPRLADFEMRIEGRTYQEISGAGGGILSSVRAVRAWTARRLTNDAVQLARSMARCGTTTVEAKSGYGLDLGSELKLLKVAQSLDGNPLRVISTCLAAHTVPPEYRGKPEDYIHWCNSTLLPEVRAKRLAVFADVYCDHGAFQVPQARTYLAAARRLGFGIKVHASQFENIGAVELGLELGAASLDHLEEARSQQVERIAHSNTVATLLPGSVLHLGRTRYAPARQLIDSGAAVALATDFNPGTSPVWNMQMVIALACSQMRMTPAEALAAATINGAHALGIADRCGSLEVGKEADVLILKLGDYRELPYYFGDNHARTILHRGIPLES